MKYIVATSLFFCVTSCAAFQNESYLRKTDHESNLALEVDYGYNKEFEETNTVDPIDSEEGRSEVRLQNPGSKRYLDASNGKDGLVISADSSSSNRQRWIERSSGKFYTFESARFDGYYLTAVKKSVSGTSITHSVRLEDSRNDDAAKWKRRNFGSDGFGFENKKFSGRWLDAGAEKKDGDFIVHAQNLEPDNGGTLRYWKFKNADDENVDLHNTTITI